MLKWLNNILIKLGLKKENAPVKPEVHVRDIDLEEIISRNERIRKIDAMKTVPVTKKAEMPLTCPTCGAEVEELHTCVKCGRQICDDCGTYCSASIVSEGEADVDSISQPGYYCENCW